MYWPGLEGLAGILGVSADALAWFLTFALIWSIVLKGFALWFSARGGQRWWFIALLVVNTLGVLEIIYLLFFRARARPGAHASPSL